MNLSTFESIPYIFGWVTPLFRRQAFCIGTSDSARPKCSPDILSGQHFPCSDNLKYFRTNDESIILFKVYF